MLDGKGCRGGREIGARALVTRNGRRGRQERESERVVGCERRGRPPLDPGRWEDARGREREVGVMLLMIMMRTTITTTRRESQLSTAAINVVVDDSGHDPEAFPFPATNGALTDPR